METVIEKRQQIASQRSILAWVRNEIILTGRMVADNIWVATAPAVVFAITAAHSSSSAHDGVTNLILALLWAFLMTYTFDAVNQAVGFESDRVDKPWRPIPKGLVTVHGMWWRAYVSCGVFIVLGSAGGMPGTAASVLYVAIMLFVYCLGPQEYYRFWKPVAEYVAVVCQIIGVWSVAGTLSAEITYIALLTACVFSIPSPIEDARDADGDRTQGRITFSTLYGTRPVGVYFAITIACVPLLAGFVLWHSSAFTIWPLILISVICLMSWFAAVDTLRARSNAAYRRAYILCSLVHVAFSAFYCAILW